MLETIKWNFVTQVLKGPSVSAAASINDVRVMALNAYS